MKCILLCAGYSMDDNLKLKETANSLTPIKGKPLVNYTIEQLENISEIDEIYLVTNGVYYSKFLEWFDEYDFSKNIKIINDNTGEIDAKLGAIGDIRYVINCENIDEEIIVLAGDVYFDFQLSAFVNIYIQNKKPIVAGMHTLDTDLLSKSGVITEKDGLIAKMQEKPLEPKGNIISLAAYIYPREVLRVIDDYLSEGNKTTYPGYLVEYLYRFMPVMVHLIEGNYFDIKTSQSVDNLLKRLG
jgi:Nucleoside-diphosphate-sugar pyrophosphorylase involved in lipopolysaccharide biosynthesis/translation initiation factor 2B, gamma/epsilon subunits (eIF-2Bgamma/eIF-2Bepsilon)